MNNRCFDQYLDLMPTTLKEKILRYRNWRDAHCSLLGKLLLLDALKDTGYGKLCLTELKYNVFGKPFFDENIDFNISHSGNFVVCVLTRDANIGIDIEEMKPVDKTHFESCWTTEEYEKIYTDDREDYDTFYNYWTKKEAIAKAIGKGLSLPMTSISVAGDRGIVTDHGKWYLKQLTFADNYVSHMACNKKWEGQIPVIRKEY
ncbi:4'-phosphopantetheinyl transferase family protein [Sinomicrobium weinanense]|uniref:4'-phosphopantetheinyl transferase superfamily protein n=1 Tax=Sinomicrobium weinanense TaxID=2842200 RepID=A0A926JQ83_9FLAO|nr:4'-phosphopantetheinyl transferase superfamily protein [Sinomicrobium weinanense]MBC9795246.1 4'-phosphopantetheinyl transferase superfamily protein [Sinomicrobium weinanense]MBU3125718.1 4'-phosphopantetheinyl transferase superfamily protein [Sinomicrobium weinanense]